MIKSIDEYITFYNEVRPHMKLGKLTTEEAETKFFEEKKEAETKQE